MNTASATPSSSMTFADHRPGFFARAEGWLEARGKSAWIAAMVLGLIFFWPIGLALLAYMIWSKRMFSKSCGQSRRHSARHMGLSSGNSAFDAYKAEILRRLEKEQSNVEAFLTRLRDPKDKAQFDQFMDDSATDAPKAKGNAENEPA